MDIGYTYLCAILLLCLQVHQWSFHPATRPWSFKPDRLVAFFYFARGLSLRVPALEKINSSPQHANSSIIRTLPLDLHIFNHNRRVWALRFDCSLRRTIP
ncbi:hypothetical protein DFP73DRAFT_551678 [Morchella snyderi]|nr:hypothetical protein DFP73DRAFT_551678 [Morchella snyderi]